MGRSTQGVRLINLDGDEARRAREDRRDRGRERRQAGTSGNGTSDHEAHPPDAIRRRPRVAFKKVGGLTGAGIQFQRRSGGAAGGGAEQAAAEMLDWHGSGMSVMEMSHRGKEFIAIHAEAEADLRELLAIPENYKVLFLQGGAAAQFAMVPMNLLRGKTIGRLRQHRPVVEEGDRRGEALLQGQHRRELRGRQLHLRAEAGRVEARSRRGVRAHTRRTRRSAASSFTGSRTPATCRSSPTCPRTSCRGRSTCAVRPDLRRRAEEHRSGGARDRDRARRSDRAAPLPARRRCSTTRSRPSATRCTTRRRPTRSTSPGWCSSG